MRVMGKKFKLVTVLGSYGKSSFMNDVSDDKHDCMFTERGVRVLKENGFRVTEPRRLILETLKRAVRPLSQLELKELIEKETQSTFDLTSSYRILETLENLGLVHRIYPNGTFIACHHEEDCEHLHLLLVCTHCGSIEEKAMPAAMLKYFSQQLKEISQFRMGGDAFQIKGKCQKCES